MADDPNELMQGYRMGVRNVSSCSVMESALLRIPTSWFFRRLSLPISQRSEERKEEIAVYVCAPVDPASSPSRTLPTGSITKCSRNLARPTRRAMNDHGARGLGASGANNLFIYIGVNLAL